MQLCTINLGVAEKKAKELSASVHAENPNLDVYITMTPGTGNGKQDVHFHSIEENKYYSLNDPELNSLTFSQGAWTFTAIGVLKGSDNTVPSNVLLEGTLSDYYINLYTDSISIPVSYKTGSGTVQLQYDFDTTKYNVTTTLYKYVNGTPTLVPSGYLANNYILDGNKSDSLASGSYAVVIMAVDKAAPGNIVLVDVCAFCVYQGQTTTVTGTLRETKPGSWTGTIDSQESGNDTSKNGLKEALEEAGKEFAKDENHDNSHVVEVVVNENVDEIDITPNSTNPTDPIFVIPDSVDEVDLDLNGSTIEIQQATFSPQTALFHVDGGKTLNINNSDETHASIIVPPDNGNNGNANATFALDGGTISLTRIIAQGPSGTKVGNSDKTALGVINLAGCSDHPTTSNGGTIELNHSTLGGNKAAITNIVPPAVSGGNANYSQITTINGPINIILDNDSHLSTKYTDAITLKNVSTNITIEIRDNLSSIDGIINLINFSGTLTIKCPSGYRLPTVNGATPTRINI